MIRILSLPLFVTASICLVLSFFFFLLYCRLRSHHKESVKYYLLFSISAFTSSAFFLSFAVLLNSGDNLDYLNIANRITIIMSMFTILISLHFYISFFDYKAPMFLKWSYLICGAFSLLAIVPNEYFLSKAFYETSEYYTGLEYGHLFELWGVWVLVLAMYCILVLVRVYIHHRNKNEGVARSSVQLLLFANVAWVITGICDTITGLGILDYPPLTWVGSFLVTTSIAWVLVLHIDKLYEERRELNNRLMYDHLTQAFSRSFLDIRLAEAISLLEHEELKSLSVCVFDVDNFKSINDQYGHASGDKLLKQITQIVKQNIRVSDCIARLGGDEFVILFAETEDKNNAINTTERIRKMISETLFSANDHQYNASCSFGIVSAMHEQLIINDFANQLLSCADEALYSAKHKGKNAIGEAALSDLS
jgi:diguanylate cyclase (GGDEF)-like protein